MEGGPSSAGDYIIRLIEGGLVVINKVEKTGDVVYHKQIGHDGWDYSQGFVFAPCFQIDLYAGLILNRLDPHNTDPITTDPSNPPPTPTTTATTDPITHILDIRDRGWQGRVLPPPLLHLVKSDPALDPSLDPAQQSTRLCLMGNLSSSSNPASSAPGAAPGLDNLYLARRERIGPGVAWETRARSVVDLMVVRLEEGGGAAEVAA